MKSNHYVWAWLLLSLMVLPVTAMEINEEEEEEESPEVKIATEEQAYIKSLYRQLYQEGTVVVTLVDQQGETLNTMHVDMRLVQHIAFVKDTLEKSTMTIPIQVPISNEVTEEGFDALRYIVEHVFQWENTQEINKFLENMRQQKPRILYALLKTAQYFGYEPLVQEIVRLMEFYTNNHMLVLTHENIELDRMIIPQSIFDEFTTAGLFKQSLQFPWESVEIGVGVITLNGFQALKFIIENQQETEGFIRHLLQKRTEVLSDLLNTANYLGYSPLVDLILMLLVKTIRQLIKNQLMNEAMLLYSNLTIDPVLTQVFNRKLFNKRNLAFLTQPFFTLKRQVAISDGSKQVISFSSTEPWLAGCVTSSSINIVDLHTDQIIQIPRVFTEHQTERAKTFPARLAFSPVSTLIAIGFADGTIHIYDRETKKFEGVIGTPSNKVYMGKQIYTAMPFQILFSPNGTKIALLVETIYSTTKLYIFDVTKRSLEATFSFEGFGAMIQFLSDQQLALLYNRNLIKIIDQSTGVESDFMKLLELSNGFMISSDKSSIVTAGNDVRINNVLLSDLYTKSSVYEIYYNVLLSHDNTLCMALSLDTSVMWLGNGAYSDRYITVWDIHMKKVLLASQLNLFLHPTFVQQKHKYIVDSCSFSPDGKEIAVGLGNYDKASELKIFSLLQFAQTDEEIFNLPMNAAILLSHCLRQSQPLQKTYKVSETEAFDALPGHLKLFCAPYMENPQDIEGSHGIKRPRATKEELPSPTVHTRRRITPQEKETEKEKEQAQ